MNEGIEEGNFAIRLTYDADVKCCDDISLFGEFRGERVTMEEIMGDV